MKPLKPSGLIHTRGQKVVPGPDAVVTQPSRPVQGANTRPSSFTSAVGAARNASPAVALPRRGTAAALNALRGLAAGTQRIQRGLGLALLGVALANGLAGCAVEPTRARRAPSAQVYDHNLQRALLPESPAAQAPLTFQTLQSSPDWQRLGQDERAWVSAAIAKNASALPTMAKLIGSMNFINANIEGSSNTTEARMMVLRTVSAVVGFAAELRRQAPIPGAGMSPELLDRAKLIENSIEALIGDHFSYRFSVTGANGATVGSPPRIALNANGLQLWSDPTPETRDAWRSALVETLVHETSHAINDVVLHRAGQMLTDEMRFFDELMGHTIGRYAASGEALSRDALGMTTSTLKSVYAQFKNGSFDAPRTEAEQNISKFLQQAYCLPLRYIASNGSVAMDKLLADWKSGAFVPPGLSKDEVDAMMRNSDDPAYQMAFDSPALTEGLRETMFRTQVLETRISWVGDLKLYDLDNNRLTLAGLNETSAGL